MWTLCLGHQLVALVFAVASRVWRAPCCLHVWGPAVAPPVASPLPHRYLFGVVLMPLWKADCHHSFDPFDFTLFLSYWVVPQRGCYCRGFSVCTFLKKGMAEGSFQTDLRNSCLGLFQHSLNCTGDYCFYTCIHCIFLFFCLMFVHCTIISWFYLL